MARDARGLEAVCPPEIVASGPWGRPRRWKSLLAHSKRRGKASSEKYMSCIRTLPIRRHGCFVFDEALMKPAPRAPRAAHDYMERVSRAPEERYEWQTGDPAAQSRPLRRFVQLC